MRNSVNREETVSKKRLFGTCNFEGSKGQISSLFHNDVVCQCAHIPDQQQQQQPNSKTVRSKAVENLILQNSIQPYQFTFLTAVKRKYMLGDYDPKCYEESNNMDMVKPLKAPDFVFSQNSNYSSKESLLSSDEFSRKFDGSDHHRREEIMAYKCNNDKAHRKLDFSPPSSPTLINSENIEPLKVPDLSISKENKLKRPISRKKVHPCDVSNLAHNRYITRREEQSSSKIRPQQQQQQQIKSLVTKKEEEKRNKFIILPPNKPKREKLLNTKNKTSSSEEGRKKLHDKILIKEGYKAMLSDSKYRTTASSLTSNSSKKSEKSVNSDSRFTKIKKNSRPKFSQETSEEIQTMSSSDQHGLSDQPHFTLRLGGLSSNQNSNEPKYSDSFSAATSSTNIETKFSEENPIPERLLDPRRISFRGENYSPQPEFCDLITPDINLMIRNKRKKQTGSKDTDSDSTTQRENEKESQLKSEIIDSISESLLQVIEESAKSRSSSEKLKKQLTSKELSKSESENPESLKVPKNSVKNVEVQTQTAIDMATQTDNVFCNSSTKNINGSSHQLSLNSEDRYEDMDRVEEMSLPGKFRTMSEISLHETTSSIKTETNTEINISAQEVICSFNKYMDFEMEQLINDEKQRYNKIEMLFKSREKTLIDKTKKLVKLQEQKKALKDSGQDSRVSSMIKKQRALLLKYEHEKEEMNRLKELHKIASRERKLMLEKQRNMFNPDMSTKNILNILKRSSDNQSPRRSSGPMKGYDIRSNSSISSIIDSDRSQLDQSVPSAAKKSDKKCLKSDPDVLLKQDSKKPFRDANKILDQIPQKESAKSKYDTTAKKYEEKMPKPDSSNKIKLQKLKRDSPNRTSESEYVKSESELLEEVSKVNRAPYTGLRRVLNNLQNPSLSQKRMQDKFFENETLKRQQFMEIRNLKRNKAQSNKKEQAPVESDRSDESYQNSVLEGIDFNESHCSYKALVQHTAQQIKEKNDHNLEDSDVPQNKSLGNLSTRSQVSLRISHHSSNDSEKSFSTSFIIKALDSNVKTDKLEQILKARELTLASRKNCVKEWINWHTRLREEENKVARMEQATYKIVSSTAKGLLHNDSTLSSDNSDVEGRIEQLTQKLADRRLEMAKLKKEARKQAKQRLRALESNLLNQIQKYDAAIEEMRKKIESKKSGKSSCVDPKSIIDFKVPEMPIKKIQEIYQSSDLLRSKTDSTILNLESRTKTPTPISKISVSGESEAESESGSVYSIKNKTITDAINTLKSASPNLELRETRSSSRSSNISEDIVQSRVNQTESTENHVTEEDQNNTSLIFSKKLDHIQVHNKELSHDIYNLENDLKELSDLMSNLSSQKITNETITENLEENSDSQKKVDEELEELEITAKGKEILNQIEKSMIDNYVIEENKPEVDDDSAIFLPRGESTNISSTFVLRLDSTNDSADQSFGIQSDQFNDIMEIIERETKSGEEDEVLEKVQIEEVIETPEPENLSEESLEVSEIINKSESGKKLSKISEATEQEPEEQKVSSIEESLQKTEVEESVGEELDTPRGVPDIEFDSPRDQDQDQENSRLDVENLDDDLLSGDKSLVPEKEEKKTEFPAKIEASTEKDIEAMIDKLKASLDQPGTEVAELEAKLLRIEQLQIELEIKKLEAEEVSYFVREIPNKPPPPYTPPAQGRILKTHGSPSPPPAVVPSNIEELSAVTEKASGVIFAAKQSSRNIMDLEVPNDICELGKSDSEGNETMKNDRKIYNAFLFDLCKEISAELYKSDEGKPGPSWTKPNVKTKPVLKVPKTQEDLNDYVSKEVATLFGFKTKLQRENMVMRWSRKRRDRVDELLAREAQAEEKEWTKFHQDELAVKNELTVAILDSLVRETTNVLKEIYARKRKIAV